MSSDTLAKPAAPSPAPSRPDGPTIVPRRRHGQRVAAVAVLVLLGLVINSVLRNRAFQWDVVADYFTSVSVLRGLWLTLWLTAVVMVLGFALGTLLAVLRLSTNSVLRSVSWGYVWLFRSIPILVQLLLWFNIGALYPQVFGIRTVNLLGPVAVAVVGLTLHEAAYAAEVVRGGILSVDHGQTEAAQALGMTPWQRWRRIVLPQAMRSIVPAAGNMLIGTLKGTSIVSVIAVNDLLFSAQLIYHRTYQVIPLLMVATLWYTVVTSVLGVGQYYVEKYYARGTETAR
ncbi:amino acid ABC transporter permease [Streptomyces sp. NPDC003656]|uniref:amino acid ABC transporter permease n=1 Tax=unclassified Streptomyces TaxID=2593676 RepID=UPI0018F5FF2F|nr:amino acid ABC transporter permease [Streptomyces sp. DSM 110735]MBJ7905370.1 amino acid ABC transporter permease [Streptomyces sp. DSM 110735]